MVDTSKAGEVGFLAANGQRMGDYGRTRIGFVEGGKPKSMGFHVTDVKKPLAAVSRIVDKGNVVVFGPGPKGSYIENVATKERMPMFRERGTYHIEVDAESGFTGQA